MNRSREAAGAAVLVAALTLGHAPAASAEPATTVAYPSAASATRLNGLAFDACDAPSTAAMQAWTASPYDGVGVYIGGPNRTCRQADLTASWVTTVSKMGWRIIPIYMGRQAPCTLRPNSVEFTVSGAASAATADAADAVAKAEALGMLPGSAIYGDLEHYTATDAACRTAALSYVSSWTKELHRSGYLSGIYAHLNSGAQHLSQTYGSTAHARPDALWIARWDANSSLTGWAGIPDAHWANAQRGKQYRGDHDETHGGVTINIDSDRFDAPVATVAYSHRITAAVQKRTAPSTAFPIVQAYAAGRPVRVVCQTHGERVDGSPVWNKLTDGNYVSDRFVDTPSETTFSRPLPRCTYPYQVTHEALPVRTGPGPSHPAVRILPAGSLAWVYCQRPGTRVWGTTVWNRFPSGNHVSDHHVATPSKTGYSRPIPRC